MPSYDISSEVDWSELDNAIAQSLKEAQTRYDFKGVKCEIELSRKDKTLTLYCSREEKFTAFREIFDTKVIKRGLSTMLFDFQKKEEASGGALRQKALVQAGISKEKGKEIGALLKESRLKVQSQIQDEKVRVTSKSRDILQESMSYLKGEQEKLSLPLQFGNFRE